MSVRAGAAAVAGAPAARRLGPAGTPRLTVVPPGGLHDHDWRLRDTEDVDGVQVRRFECDGCGGVDFT